MVGRGRVLGIVGGVALVLGLGGLFPARAASSASTAPYSAAEHSANVSCPDLEPTVTCQAAADADAGTGVMTLSSSVDSGANGHLPSSAASAVANGTVGVDLDVEAIQQLTATVHVTIADLRLASSDQGRASVVVWAMADCDGCDAPRTRYAIASEDGDLALVVTLTKGGSAARFARLTVGTSASSRLDCNDFCVATLGTAQASANATLVSVDVSTS